MNEKTLPDGKMIKRFFSDLPEKRGLKNIYKKEEEYAGVLAPIELAIACCYLRNPHIKDSDAALALKNFREDYDKKFAKGTLEYVIQSAVLAGLGKFTKNKKISEHEFLLAIDYVLWAISNREWIPDERAYLKWICNFFGLLEGREKEDYEEFYARLGHDMNIPKGKLEILKHPNSKQIANGTSEFASQDGDGRIISRKTGRNEPCPCGSGKKYKKCCMGKLGDNGQHTSAKKIQSSGLEPEKSDKNIGKILQLRISLDRITPPVWRRVLVEDSTSFRGLHDVIQTMMGWGDCHLYGFAAGGLDIGEPNEFDGNIINSKKIKLCEVLKTEKQKIYYTYDFGDCWDHTILVERILEKDDSKKYPVCTAGKRACPPEDCGGVGGYYELLEIRQNKNHPEYPERIKDWLGEDYDPEHFDLNEINELLE